MDESERRSLITLLGQQKEVYQEILDLVSRQEQALKSEDTQTLLNLAQEVSDLKSRAEKLQADIDPLKTQWESGSQDIPSPDQEVLKTLMEEIREVLDKILGCMNRLRDDVTVSRTDTLDRLKNLSQGQVARKGYSQLGRIKRSHPRFMDRDG